MNYNLYIIEMYVYYIVQFLNLRRASRINFKPVGT